MKKQLVRAFAILFSPVFLSCNNDNDSTSNENVIPEGEAESVGGRNHILIKVDRNMAKVSLHNKKGDNSTEAEFESTDGKNKIGVVAEVNYAIHGHLWNMKYIQKCNKCRLHLNNIYS